MTELAIANGLRWLVQPAVAVPNTYALGEHESDVLVLTKADLLWEYEIKLSAADYRVDAGAEGSAKWRRQQVLENAHQKKPLPTSWVGRRCRVDNRPSTVFDPCFTPSRGRPAPACPNRFYYVIPKGLVDTAEIPCWAGVLHPRAWRGPRQVFFDCARKAPLLHREKAPDRVVKRLLSSLHDRYWRLKTS